MEDPSGTPPSTEPNTDLDASFRGKQGVLFTYEGARPRPSWTRKPWLSKAATILRTRRLADQTRVQSRTPSSAKARDSLMSLSPQRAG
jgi:hypothetical protein